MAPSRVAPSVTPQSLPAPAPSDAAFERLKKAFEAGDLDGYAEAFAPELRETERRKAAGLRDDFGMTSILFRVAGRITDESGRERVFLQVFFQNDISAMLENWRVAPVLEGGAWRIAEKEVSGTVNTLYKLRLPAGRAVQAGRVEIRHADFRLTFTDATVFYDNLPDFETGLIVIGEGRLLFTPSSETERHQLELRFKAPQLEDRIDAAYLRFSPSFFRSNIQIEDERPFDQQSEAGRARANQAYALFSAGYAGSFTVENSLTGQPMTFLPQGEQVVFELKARKAGDLTYIFSPFSDDEIHLAGRNPNRIINLYSPGAEGGELKRMFVSFGEKIDVLGYQIDIDCQPEKKYLSARARMEFTARLDDVDSLKLYLHPDLDILRVLDQDGRGLFTTQDKSRGLLYVYLLTPLAKGTTGWIEVFYRGVLDPPTPTSDVLAAAQLGTTISLVGPRFETLLYSQSANWYPSPTEDDFFLAKVRVVVPPGFTCVGNGPAVETGVVDNLRRVTALDKVGHPFFGFETKTPVKYLSFLVGRLSPIGDGDTSGPVPVEAFYASDIRLPRRTLLEESRSVLQALIDLVRALPVREADRHPAAMADRRRAQPGLLRRLQRAAPRGRWDLRSGGGNPGQPGPLPRGLPGPRDRPPVVGPGRDLGHLSRPVAERGLGPVRRRPLPEGEGGRRRLPRIAAEVRPLDGQEVPLRPGHPGHAPEPPGFRCLPGHRLRQGRPDHGHAAGPRRGGGLLPRPAGFLQPSSRPGRPNVGPGQGHGRSRRARPEAVLRPLARLASPAGNPGGAFGPDGGGENGPALQRHPDRTRLRLSPLGLMD